MGAENYRVIRLVVEGSFGKVYKGSHQLTGQMVSMIFIMKHGKSDKDIHNLRQKIEILRKLKHEYIIEMLDFFESPLEFCVVTMFAQGELFEILVDDEHLPEAIAKPLEMESATAAERGCVAAWRGEGKKIQTPGGLAFSCPGMPSESSLVKSGILLNMGSTGVRLGLEDRDMVRLIEGDVGKYITIFLEVGVPGIILWCLEHLELKDWGRTVVSLAKMIGQRPLAIQLVNKGLLDPTRMRDLLDRSSPIEVILHVLMIVSDFAGMDKIGNAAYHIGMFYELLWRSMPQLANLLLLSEEDKTKANAAGALDNFVRNSNELCKDIVTEGPRQGKLFDDASFFKVGSTIGALLYKGGVMAFRDSRCATLNYDTEVESIQDGYVKFFEISPKSNLYMLVCGDIAYCEQLARYLKDEAEFVEIDGDLVTIDLATVWARQYLFFFLEKAPARLKERIEFGGIIIGWRADQSYQASRILLKQETVQDVQYLSDSDDLEDQSKKRERIVLGCGAEFADDMYARLEGANAEMSEDLARAVSLMLSHTGAVMSPTTGGDVHVYAFRHGVPFDKNSCETIRPLELQVSHQVTFRDQLVLMRVKSADVGLFTDFQKDLTKRVEVQCASLMFSSDPYNYYRIHFFRSIGVDILFHKLMQRHVQRVGLFEQVWYTLGTKGDILVEMAKCTNNVLDSLLTTNS